MGTSYTMKYITKTTQWESVRVRAGLTMGAEEALMLLSPEFKVEDSPDIKVGYYGGIASGILSIVDKKLVQNGELVEFYVKLNEPSSQKQWQYMATILGNQMGFELKVTVYPIGGMMPGVPIDIMSAMADRSAESITVFLEVPKDRLKVEPDVDRLDVASTSDIPMRLISRCEQMNFVEMAYVPAIDKQGRPILPNVDFLEATEYQNMIKIEEEKDEHCSRFVITPQRFVVGNGSPIKCQNAYIRCPLGFKDAEPNHKKILLCCDTQMVNMEFRVYQEGKELMREQVVVNGEQVHVNIQSASGNVKLKNMDLAWQVMNPGGFYMKTHEDLGRITIDSGRPIEFSLLKSGTPYGSCTINLEVPDEAVDGVLKLSKCTWAPIDKKLSTLFSISEEELAQRLSGAQLEVKVEGLYEGIAGNVNIPMKDCFIQDMLGSLTVGKTTVEGTMKGDVLVFPSIGEAIPGKRLELELVMKPEDMIRDSLEGIHEQLLRLDEELLPDFEPFGRSLLTWLATESNGTLGGNLQKIYGKLAAIETFFGKLVILKKDGDITFDLRSKAATQIINNLVGFLIETAINIYEIKSKNGALLNSEANMAEIQVKRAYKNKQIATKVTKNYNKVVTEAQEELVEAQAAVLKVEQKVQHLVDETGSLMEKIRYENTPAHSKRLLELREATDVAMKERDVLLSGVDKKSTLLKERFDVLEKLKLAEMSDGDALQEIIKDMRPEIGVLQVGGFELMEELAKYDMKQDYELLAALHEEKEKGTIKPFLQKMGSMITVNKKQEIVKAQIVPSYNDFYKLAFDNEMYNQFVKEAISSISMVIDGIWDMMSNLPALLSEALRDNSWVDHRVNEPYRSHYSKYPHWVAECLPDKVPEPISDAFTGAFIIKEMEAGAKPTEEWVKRAESMWRAEDIKNRESIREQFLVLTRFVLETEPNGEEWLDTNLPSFEKAGNATDQLIQLIRQYDASFDDERKWSMEGNRSWQHVDNMINEIAFYSAWGLRIVSWISLYSGWFAPLSLPMSKIADTIDWGGALLQTGVSFFLTLPEINGIVEANPIAACMMHHSLVDKSAEYGDDILTFS